MLAQLQMEDEQYAEALATIDRFLTETKSQKPEYLVTKGNILYRLQRYPEAITALKQGIDAAGADAKPEWQQLLMAAYFDSNQPAEAAQIAESALAKNPDDKKLQMNLASIYMQADQNDKAIALLEKMRAKRPADRAQGLPQPLRPVHQYRGQGKGRHRGHQGRHGQGHPQAGLPDLPGAGPGLLLHRPARPGDRELQRPRRWPPMARPTSTWPRSCGTGQGRTRPSRPRSRRWTRASRSQRKRRRSWPSRGEDAFDQGGGDWYRPPRLV